MLSYKQLEEENENLQKTIEAIEDGKRRQQRQFFDVLQQKQDAIDALKVDIETLRLKADEQEANEQIIQSKDDQIDKLFVEKITLGSLVENYRLECARPVAECGICRNEYFFYSDFWKCPRPQCSRAVCNDCVANGHLKQCPYCRKKIPFESDWMTIPSEKQPKLIRDEKSSQLNQGGIVDVRFGSKMHPCINRYSVTL